MNLSATDFTDHPEGGRFREVYRSTQTVQRADQPERSACTHIYFHLRQGEVSKFHKVQQEEIWNLYRGALRVWIFDESAGTLETHTLSAEENVFCTVVPAGNWQAAQPISDDALAGCTVAPGFEFEDFELIHPEHPAFQSLKYAGLEFLL